MNLTSALLKQIITQKDFDTWGNLRENYLPTEYQTLHRVMTTHIKNYSKLPTFEDLKLSIRDRQLQEKIFAIEAVDVDVEACGGTHLKNTSEAKGIKIIKSTKIQDGICRIVFTAGKAAKQQIEGEQDIINKLVFSKAGVFIS